MNLPGATDVGRQSFQELAVPAWRDWSVCFGYSDWAGRAGGWAAPDFVGRGCRGVCASDAGAVRHVDSTCFIRPLRVFAKRWPFAWHCCGCGTPGVSRRRRGSASGPAWPGLLQFWHWPSSPALCRRSWARCRWYSLRSVFLFRACSHSQRSWCVSPAWAAGVS